MKCPKCSYFSFDYNLTCPKCDKDISSEQEKLHLPAFRPNPPFLLGALIGEANESQFVGTRSSAEIHFDREPEPRGLEPSEDPLPESVDFDLDSERISFDDSTLSLDSEERQAVGRSEEDDILGIDMDAAEAVADFDLGGPEDQELGSDMEDLEFESNDAADTDEELSLDLDEAPEQEDSLDFDSLDLEGGPGESTEELDKLLKMDEIQLEEVPLDANSGPEKAKGQSLESDLSLDLGELELELDLDNNRSR